MGKQRPALPIQKLVPFFHAPPRVHDLTLAFPLFQTQMPLEVTCDIRIPTSARGSTNSIDSGTFRPLDRESSLRQQKWGPNEQLAIHSPIIMIRSLQVAPCSAAVRNYSQSRNKVPRPQVRVSHPMNPVRVILSSYNVGVIKPPTYRERNQCLKNPTPQESGRLCDKGKIDVGDDWCIIEEGDIRSRSFL
ncbi:hypothetical protein M433DRAFT_153937, partial [Acidomyces richmondensis BFW]